MRDLETRAARMINGLRSERFVGHVIEINGNTIVARGLSTVASLGDRVIIRASSADVAAEIVRLTSDWVYLTPDETLEGVQIGDSVLLTGSPGFAPDPSWIGRVIDPDGRPLDNRPILGGVRPVALHAAPPKAYQRRGLGERLATGLIVFDTLLPLVKGQRIGLFAGSGVGKSTLLATLARGIACDVAVIALVGERGREVREFVDSVLGPEGLARSVVVAATSDRAPQIRKRCALSAIAVAEYFRDLGLHVLLLVDSVTRFAEAHREVSATSGEAGFLRGYPASTPSAIAGLCERAGPGSGDTGDITAIYSVLVAGSDMEEPVADMLRGVLDGHVVLDRAIAEAGRYPAVDVLRSVSRSLPQAATPDENELLSDARRLIGAYARSDLMIKAGLYAKGSDTLVDRAILKKPGLDRLLSTTSQSVEDSFQQLRAVIADTKSDRSGIHM